MFCESMYGFIFIACFRRVLECSAVLGLFLFGEYEKQRKSEVREGFAIVSGIGEKRTIIKLKIQINNKYILYLY